MLEFFLGMFVGSIVAVGSERLYRMYQDHRQDQLWKTAGKEWKSTLQKMEDIGMHSVEFGGKLVEEAREGAFREDNKMPDDETKEHQKRIAMAEFQYEANKDRQLKIDEVRTEKIKARRQKRIEADERLTEERLT